MTTEIFEALKKPFPVEDVEWRLGRVNEQAMTGIALAYIDARLVINRLDSVVGPENWQDAYETSTVSQTVKGNVAQYATVRCRLSLRIAGEWLYKEDGAPFSDFEAVKGGYSDALKRAAVKWGIGRYLYDLPPKRVSVERRGNSWAIAAGQDLSSVLPPAASPKNPSRNLKVRALEDRKADILKAFESLGLSREIVLRVLEKELPRAFKDWTEHDLVVAQSIGAGLRQKVAAHKSEGGKIQLTEVDLEMEIDFQKQLAEETGGE